MENSPSNDIWEIELLRFITDTQKWIDSKWNKSESSAKIQLICSQLISSLEIIPRIYQAELLKWIRESIVSKKQFILPSIQDSLEKDDKMNNGRRPWLVYQFKALL